MKPYQLPQIVQAQICSSFFRLQGTGTNTDGQPQAAINCEGFVPSGCESLFGPVINSNCIDSPNGSYHINVFISGITCEEIVSQCTVTINGQNPAAFCTSSFGGTDFSTDCGGGCLVPWECSTIGSCSTPSVEISCPGYESCNTTVVTPV